MKSKHSSAPGAMCILLAIMLIVMAAPEPLLAQAFFTVGSDLPRAESPIHSSPPWQAHLVEREAPDSRSADATVCSDSGSSPASNGTSTFGRIYQIAGEETWGDAVFPTSYGYLVVGDHSISNGFCQNLTEFDNDGHPLRSRDLSTSPGVPKSARATSDGGYLIGTYHDLDAFEDEGRLLKLSPELAVEWAKAFRTGPPSYSHIAGAAETADGGYIALARAGLEIAVVKLDASGNVDWSKRIIPTDSTVTNVYDLYESTYVDGEGETQCGGYVLYAGVRRAATDWDLYLAALSCDGETLFWQRTIAGAQWEGTRTNDENDSFMSYATNLLNVEDRSGLESQDVDLLVAATTDSFGTGWAFLLVPINVTGGTELSNPPTLGPVKILDSINYERIIGPFGGPNLMRLEDGNLLLGGSMINSSTWIQKALLAKIEPDLDSVLWQHTYGQEESVGLHETEENLIVVGGGPLGLLLRLEKDGSGGRPCVMPNATSLSLSDITPSVVTPAYALDEGTIEIADVTVTITDTTAVLTCPDFAYAPLVQKKFP